MLGSSLGIKRTLTAQAAARALLLPEGPEEEAKTSVILSGELALHAGSLAVGYCLDQLPSSGLRNRNIGPSCLLPPSPAPPPPPCTETWEPFLSIGTEVSPLETARDQTN